MPGIITPGAMTCKLHCGSNWGYFDTLLGRLTAEAERRAVKHVLSSEVLDIACILWSSIRKWLGLHPLTGTGR